MKKLSVFIIGVSLLYSCKQESNASSTNDDSNKELWAEQIESSASLVKPEGWTQEEWQSVSRGIDREKIFNAILESVMSGKQQAYNYISDEPITIEEVKEIVAYTDTVFIANEDGSVTPTLKRANDISSVRCREQWYFDKEKFSIQSKISSIALFTNAYSAEGDLRGVKALFYVKLNN